MRKVYTIYNNIIASIFILLAVSNLHSACIDAEDYGIISTGTVLSGDFNSDFDDYWIKFSTSQDATQYCQFNQILHLFLQ